MTGVPAPGRFDCGGMLVQVNPVRSDGRARIWQVTPRQGGELSVFVGEWPEGGQPWARSEKYRGLVALLASDTESRRLASGPCPICETLVQDLTRHTCRSKKAQRQRGAVA